MVSVIITTLNEEANIGRILSSLKNQSLKDIEIIVVDNNSIDKTVSIAKEFTSKVYNKGPERSAQRNYGVSKAHGKYVLILDADMELTPKVIENCVKTAEKTGAKALVIAEKTVGTSFIIKIRQFEREMYMGDPTVEVARFFEKKIFLEYGGYDLELTGPEDYDLPYRISKKYKVDRVNEYILHHEEGRSLFVLLKRKFYYASQGAVYAKKHPELVSTQGNLLFRKAYIKNWRKFLEDPVIGLSFVFVRILEAIAAVAGFIYAVGIINFVRLFINMIRGKNA